MNPIKRDNSDKMPSKPVARAWGEVTNPNTSKPPNVGVRTSPQSTNFFYMRYRRANVPRATYFFTVNLAERNSRLLVEHVDVLRESVRYVKKAHPFAIDAMVIMPNHLHALWALPEGDNDYPTRWGLIKLDFQDILMLFCWTYLKQPITETRRPVMKASQLPFDWDLLKINDLTKQ